MKNTLPGVEDRSALSSSNAHRVCMPHFTVGLPSVVQMCCRHVLKAIELA